MALQGRHVWRITAAVGAVALLASAANGAMAAPGAPAGSAHGGGKATAAVVLPSVTVTDPTGAALPVALGTVSTSATSKTPLQALLNVQGFSALGQNGPSYAIDSASGPKSGELTVPATAGPVTASLQSAKYNVGAVGGTASAAVSVLTGALHTSVVDLNAGLGDHGVNSVAGASQSSAALDATFGGLNLGLGNLLPASVLSALPLSQLLSLLSSLHVSLPATVAGAIAALNGLPGLLSSLQAGVAGVTSAATSLQSAQIAASPAIGPAQQAVQADGAAVTAAQAQVTSCQANAVCSATQLPALMAALTAAQAKLTSDSATLQTLQAAVAANPAVAMAQGALDQAVGSLVNVLGSLSNQLVNLPDLAGLLNQLLGLLKGAPLVSVGSLGVSLSSAADAASGTGTAACSLGGVTLLGNTLATPTCDSLRQQLQSVQGAVSGVLAALPLAAGITPKVTVDGLVTSQSGATKPAADGTAQSSAGLTPLHLNVGSLSLGSVVDTLLSGLLAQVQQATNVAASLTGGTAGIALPSQATGALGTVGTQLTTLAGQLQGLPAGAALAGLRTIGLDASLGGATTQASFAPAPAPPAATPAPGDPKPGVEIPRSLPRTGGTHTLELVALGLLMLMAGWHLVEVSRATDAERRSSSTG
ncbi:MAG TPA: hypothetical protein VKI20_08065 [Acidimicrobiales bacterium]|nr:hypothetical protein [Acidimicrobiales bacterium]